MVSRQVSGPGTAVAWLWVALCYASQGSADCPNTEPGTKWVSAPSLTVATLNLAHGRKDALNQMLLSRQKIEQNLQEVGEQLRESGAQVIALQEADAPSRWSGGFDHVALLAIQARYPCYFHGLHDQSSFSRYGTAILAQQPLEDSFSHTFAPSWPTKPKGFVLTYIHWNPGDRLPAALRVALVSVHLDFSRDSVRQRQIEEMIAILQAIHGPLVVMGDFNAGWAAPGSAARLLAEALNLQAFEPLSEEFGSYVGDNKRLDWILISEQLRFVGYHVISEVVSDHFTVAADVAPAGSP